MTVGVLALISGAGAATATFEHSGASFLNTTASSGNVIATGYWVPEHAETLGTVECGGSSSVVAIGAGGVPTGDMIAVFVGMRDGSGTVSATDSQSNTYTVQVDRAGGSQRVVILTAPVTTALSSGNSVTVTHPDGNTEGVAVERFRHAGSVDETADNAGNSSTPSVGITIGTNRLMFAALSVTNTRTVSTPSGWTSLGTLALDCGGGAPRKSTEYRAYRVTASGTWSFSPTLSGSDQWVAGIAALLS